jgi:ESX secretion-associated protein EspB
MAAMTQPQTLNVEYAELMARADEIERPLEHIPPNNPPPPCALSYAKDAATQIGLSADAIRLYLKGCQREWQSLAKSLRDAAKAYQLTDEGSADAITNEGSALDIARSGSADDPDEDWVFDPPPPPPVSPPFDYPYYEVRQAMVDIETGDQGEAFTEFAHDWARFQLVLQEETYRFRPFSSWEGDARSAVESNFEQQRQWIYAMVQLCATLSKQALGVADAQKKVRAPNGSVDRNPDGSYPYPAEHPGPVDISYSDYLYRYYTQNDPQNLWQATSWYEELQAKSEEALRLYAENASLPLPPLNPSMFPTVSAIPDFRLGSDDGVGDIGSGDLPSGDGFSGMPQMPSLPMGGMPSTPDTSTPAAPPVPAPGKGLSAGPGIKPASFAGGGVGVPAAPKMPLQPWGDNAATAGAAAGPGRPVPVPAAYAALNGKGAGGGMGGGMPMGGAGGQNQGAGKGKAMAEQKAIYTERRQWTEGVIGRRVHKGGPDQDKATRPKSPPSTADVR